VAYRGPEPRWERHKGLVGQRRPPEADESRLAGRSAAASDPRHGESPCLPSPGGATPRTGTQEARAWDSRGRSLAQAWLAGRVAAPAQLWPLGPQSPVAVYWPHKDLRCGKVIPLLNLVEEGGSHVLDLSEGSSKLIPIHEEPNHQIVHLFRLGKAQRPTHSPLDTGPEIDVLTLDFLCVLLPHVMLLGLEMPLVGPPAVGVILCDAKRF